MLLALPQENSYNDDQLVPTANSFDIVSRGTTAGGTVINTRKSLPDFESLLKDISSTFDLSDFVETPNALDISASGSGYMDYTLDYSYTPAPNSSQQQMMDLGCYMSDDVTFYDDPIYIKQEHSNIDCLKQHQQQPFVQLPHQHSPEMVSQNLPEQIEFQTLTKMEPVVVKQEVIIPEQQATQQHQQQPDAMEEARKEIADVCQILEISADAYQWSVEQTQRWVTWALKQYSLNINYVENFHMDGTNLCLLTETAFQERCPEAGQYLYVQLDVWKSAFQMCSPSTVVQDELPTFTDLDASNGSSHSFLPVTVAQQCYAPTIDIPKPVMGPSPSMSPAPSVESLDSSSSSVHSYSPCRMSPHPSENLNSTATSSSHGSMVKGPTPGKHNIQLWQFLRELLMSPEHYCNCIRWIDRSKGIFKIEDSQRVARLWGQRKNRPAMNYDKLSRSIRQYYKKGIIKKTDNSKRLVYQFCPQYRI